MKKVLYIINSNFFGGVAKVIKNISEELSQEKDVKIYILTNKILKKYFEDIKNIKILENDSINKIKYIYRLQKIISKEKIDIVHFHDNKNFIYFFLGNFMKIKKIKVILHIHACPKWLQTCLLKRFIHRFFLKKSDIIIFCGKKVKEYYKKYLDISGMNTIVLSNSIKIEKIEKIKNNKTVYSFIGRLEDEKGILDLIVEIKNSKRYFEESQILVIGEGGLEKNIQSYIKKEKLDDIIKLVGFKENLQEFYDKTDILILPSKTEALPMVILEAMANRCIVLSMDVGSISEVIINEKTGYLIEKGTYDKFVEKMIFLKDKKDIKIIENAYKYVEKNYNLTNYKEKLKRIYLEL